jgi:phage terminase large subunit-like protein
VGTSTRSNGSSSAPPARAKPVLFDEASAQRAVDFFEKFLVHSKGEWAGRPFLLAPWQKSVVRQVFGTKRPDGTRQYRRVDIWLPKKNGKSTFAAGLALYLLLADGEPGAEVYGVANDRSQAEIVFEEAARMRAKSPLLSEMTVTYRSTSAIVHPESVSAYQAVSSEIQNKDGLNISGLIVDELHEWKDRRLLSKLTLGVAARRQALIIVISTAGDDPNSVAYEEYRADKAILEGKSRIRDRLVVIYEAPPGSNWKRAETWKRANPGYGDSVKPSYLRDKFNESLGDAGKEADFQRYHLNMWRRPGAGSINMLHWASGARKYTIADGDPCFVGLDLSRRADITAAVALFRQGPAFKVLAQFFIPADGLEERERRDRVPYARWRRLGLLRTTPGNLTEYAAIRDFLLTEWAPRYAIQEVCFDPYNASHLVGELEEGGLTCTEIQQTNKNIGPATRDFKNLLTAGHLWHAGHPILEWMASNAASRTDAGGNERFHKGRSTGRIDGIAAIVTALVRASAPQTGPSIYEAGEFTVTL